MRNFQGGREKKGWRNIFESWPMLVILSVFIFIFAFGIFGFMGKMRETAKNKTIAENKVLEMESRREKLVLDIANLNTDEGKEKIFRENFGLAKEGEGLIVVVDEKESTEDAELKKEGGFFYFFKNLFK